MLFGAFWAIIIMTFFQEQKKKKHREERYKKKIKRQHELDAMILRKYGKPWEELLEQDAEVSRKLEDFHSGKKTWDELFDDDLDFEKKLNEYYERTRST